MKTKTPKVPKPIHTMGVVLPRNDLTKALVRAHVVAVQEYDHPRALFIEQTIRGLANLRIPQPKKHSYLKQASERVYDLDEKVGMEFHKASPPLFMASTHGYILSELTEIRMLINCAINTNERERDENKDRPATKPQKARKNRGPEAERG